MNNLSIRKVYYRDFDELPAYLTLADGERVVSVELGSRFPVRVWIEGGDDRAD